MTSDMEETMELRYVEPLADVLARAGDDAGDLWLWCIYCERFFQARNLQVDFLGNREGCPLCSCAGFNIAIHLWNTWGEADPAWPKSVEDLYHGMPLPPPPSDGLSSDLSSQ